MDSEEDRRYERARKLAYRYMDRTRTNTAGLAELIGDRTGRRVATSSVTRFLNATPGFEPSPGRPSMVAILQGILMICGSPVRVLRAPAREAPPRSDEEAWFEEHLCRLHQIQTLLPSEGLALIGPLTAEAVHGPPDFLGHMIGNLLGTIADLLDRPEALSAMPALVEETADRIKRLILAATGLTDEAMLLNIAAIGSYALCYCEKLLGSWTLADGVRMLGALEKLLEIPPGSWPEGLTSPSDHLENGLCLAEDFLEGATREAVAYADELGLLVGRYMGWAVRRAWQMTDTPDLRRHWSTSVPGLVEQLDAPTMTRREGV